MAKTKAATTRSAFSFVPGNVATKDDLQTVHEMQNEARCDTVQTLLNLQSGGQGWGGGSELSPAGYGITWPAAGTVSHYQGFIYIDPDVPQLTLRSVATMPAGATGSTLITVGGGSTTHSHAAGSTTTDDQTLNTSTTGTGWQAVLVELRRDTGDPSTGVLERAKIRTVPITASALPDPI